ncbi:MAG: hypothetical protein WBF53_03025 [Litorimonas sp.]
MRADDRHRLDRWLAIHQPRLRLSTDETGRASISGVFDLVTMESGNPPTTYASFEIDFIIPDDFPSSLPKVFETGGQIERKPEHHINGDGSICYGVPVIIAARRPDMSVDTFISEILHDYFLGYLCYQERGTWPFGEVGHGYTGALEYLAELLDCDARPNKVRALLALLSLKHRRDRWHCPCGSGKRLGQCCRSALNRASRRLTRREALRLRPSMISFEAEAENTAEHAALVTELETLRADIRRYAAACLGSAPDCEPSSPSIKKRMVQTVSRRAVDIQRRNAACHHHQPFTASESGAQT